MIKNLFWMVVFVGVFFLFRTFKVSNIITTTSNLMLEKAEAHGLYNSYEVKEQQLDNIISKIKMTLVDLKCKKIELETMQKNLTSAITKLKKEFGKFKDKTQLAKALKSDYNLYNKAFMLKGYVLSVKQINGSLTALTQQVIFVQRKYVELLTKKKILSVQIELNGITGTTDYSTLLREFNKTYNEVNVKLKKKVIANQVDKEIGLLDTDTLLDSQQKLTPDEIFSLIKQ